MSWDVIIPREDLKERYGTKGLHRRIPDRTRGKAPRQERDKRGPASVRGNNEEWGPGGQTMAGWHTSRKLGERRLPFPAFLPSEESTALTLTAQASLLEQEAT